MKKLISLLCVLAVIVGIIAVSTAAASAAEPSKTVVNVKKGNTVTYCIKLSDVANPVIGCDYSIYYDSKILQVESVLDFDDNPEGKWNGGELINTNLNGQVRGNWSILNGVSFNNQRNFITVNFKAVADGETEISYFVRYMYDENIFNDESRPQITEYKFVCDVSVNGNVVLEDAQPQLNVEETQTSGLFVNSVTGDSADADASIPGTVVKQSTPSSNSAQQSAGGSGGSTGGNSGGSGSVSSGTGSSNSSTSSAQADAPLGTTAEGYYIIEVDDNGRVITTADEAPAASADSKDSDDSDSGKKSMLLWIILGLIVLAGGGAAAFFYFTKRSSDGKAAANDVIAPIVGSGAVGNMDAADIGDAKTELIGSDAENTVVADLGGEKTELLNEGEEKTELLDQEE